MSKSLVLSAALLALLAATVPTRSIAGDEPELSVGDPAPPLSIDTWLKGAPVGAFEKGRVYVVEFWATWCGPCIAGMPHLSDLQREYGDKGLTIIGVTKEDPRNSLEDARRMVAEKDELMAYTVAFDRGGQTYDAYMRAAGQQGIPCAFVVDREGHVAYVGHPMWLDIPIEGILAGTWAAEEGMARIRAAEARRDAIHEAAVEDPEKALELIAAFTEEHPRSADMFQPMRFSLLLDLGRLDEGFEVGRAILARALKRREAMVLNGVASRIVDPRYDLERRDLELAADAARAANELSGGANAWVLATLARVHWRKGELAEAVRVQKSAIGHASGTRLRQQLQETLAEYEAAAEAERDA